MVSAGGVIDKPSVNNELYDQLGDRWYTANDDPVALLRHESKIKTAWILSKLEENGVSISTAKILDVGCGAGFVSNSLALKGYTITGLDQSEESLRVAKKYDSTGKVSYLSGDAYHLPFADQSLDVVTALDFLEHVERPAEVVTEISRVLKPGGLFFYHTFNRNPLAYLVIIKLVELLVKNVPPHLHVLHLFIKPKELRAFCAKVGLTSMAEVGIRPVFSTVTWKALVSRTVPENFRFKLTKSLLLSYMGVARKNL